MDAKTRRYAPIAILLTAALLLPGCANLVQDTGQDPDDGPPATAGASLDDDVIRTAEGTKQLSGTPERIVALEWVYVSNLLTLGIQPVGVADVDGYEKWVEIPRDLDTENVTDVGTRTEPSMEKIAALEPDLIIGPSYRLQDKASQLEKIAPTLLFTSYPSEDGPRAIDRMEDIILQMGDAVDREERALQAVGETHHRFNQVREELHAADLTGHRVTVAAAFTYEGSTVMRLYTNNSVAIQALEQVGLRNAWSDGFAKWGFSTTGLESLATVEDSTFLYIAHEDDDPFAEGGAWADNSAWQNLTFVQEGRVHHLPGDTWLLGGPLSIQRFVQLTADRLMTDA